MLNPPVGPEAPFAGQQFISDLQGLAHINIRTNTVRGEVLERSRELYFLVHLYLADSAGQLDSVIASALEKGPLDPRTQNALDNYIKMRDGLIIESEQSGEEHDIARALRELRDGESTVWLENLADQGININDPRTRERVETLLRKIQLNCTPAIRQYFRGLGLEREELIEKDKSMVAELQSTREELAARYIGQNVQVSAIALGLRPIELDIWYGSMRGIGESEHDPDYTPNHYRVRKNGNVKGPVTDIFVDGSFRITKKSVLHAVLDLSHKIHTFDLENKPTVEISPLQ